MKDLRILFISSAFEMSGSYFRSFFLAKYLVEEGHKVLLTTTSRKATLHVAERLVDGVGIFSLPSFGFSNANLFLRSLSRAATSFMQTLLNCILEVASDFDVVHSFDVMFPQNATPTLFSMISRFFQLHDRKIFVDWDDWWGRGGILSSTGGLHNLMNPFATFLEEKIPLYADAVTVITETLRQRALQAGATSENLFMIPNGANVDFVKPLNTCDARRKLNLPIGKLIYTHLGDLGWESLKLLILAHKKVIRHCPNALLLLVGLRKDRINFVTSTDVGGNAICYEWQPYHKVQLYLGASDLFLLPRKDNLMNRAAWPLRLGDYLAAGRPIIATALPETEKIMCKCGFVAKPGDPDDFARKILGVIEHPDLRKEMGKRARELAETRYSWQILAKQLERVYRRYL